MLVLHEQHGRQNCAHQNLERLSLGGALRACAGHWPKSSVHHKLLSLQYSVAINLGSEIPCVLPFG
jgi:hypothetical protein